MAGSLCPITTVATVSGHGQKLKLGWNWLLSKKRLFHADLRVPGVRVSAFWASNFAIILKT